MEAFSTAAGKRRRRLQRRECAHHRRSLTFSTSLRLPLFRLDRIKDRFSEHLAGARFRWGFNPYAWVVMPELVHLLLWPRSDKHSVSVMLRELKRRFAEDVITRWRTLHAPILARLTANDGSVRFWQRGGGYDRNICSDDEFGEKLGYIHRNPVARGLVERADDWRWSSASWYRGGYVGPVTIDPLPARVPTDGTQEWW